MHLVSYLVFHFICIKLVPAIFRVYPCHTHVAFCILLKKQRLVHYNLWILFKNRGEPTYMLFGAIPPVKCVSTSKIHLKSLRPFQNPHQYLGCIPHQNPYEDFVFAPKVQLFRSAPSNKYTGSAAIWKVSLL